MRTTFLSLMVGTIGLSLAGLLAAPGRASDNHGSPTSKPELRTDARRGVVNPPGREDLTYPPVEPYRQLYYFPDPAPARPPSDKLRDVSVSDIMYSPSILYVSPGTTVRWTNRGTHHHTITSDWLWESGELKPGQSFVLKFMRKGTYYYYCRLHSQYMKGKIVVYY
jgi:plastocyanin